MSRIEVIKVDPLDLPADIVWQISGKQHISLKEFCLYVHEKENKMYVNKSIPEKDIKKFVKIVASPSRYINDDDTETGKLMEYVYRKYGKSAYISLFDYNQCQIEQQDEQRAQEQLQEVLPLIEEMAMNEHPIINYDEHLIYEISKKGMDCKTKTPKNKVNYGDIYIFYLGYLVGLGKINSDDYSLDTSENVFDYYYKIAEMLEHIDIREMPRIYGYLKEMYFS